MPGGRGGKRTPAHPAPVSGPGALSARTDGGPGQPVRVVSGGGYGDRKAMVEQQQAAPMQQGGPSVPAAQPGQGQPQQGFSGPVVDPFGPSRRPGEPATAGAASGPGAAPPNPHESTVDALQALIAVMPDLAPEIQDMLAQAQREVGR